MPKVGNATPCVVSYSVLSMMHRLCNVLHACAHCTVHDVMQQLYRATKPLRSVSWLLSYHLRLVTLISLELAQKPAIKLAQKPEGIKGAIKAGAMSNAWQQLSANVHACSCGVVVGSFRWASCSVPGIADLHTSAGTHHPLPLLRLKAVVQYTSAAAAMF